MIPSLADPSIHHEVFMPRSAYLPPDRFLYNRAGPWPQPSPWHPLREAPEVLNVPLMEKLLFDQTIGLRYLKTQAGYPPMAAAYAVQNLNYMGPDDAGFESIMLTKGAYTRFLRRLSPADESYCLRCQVPLSGGSNWYIMDFRAMQLIEPLEGMYVAPTVVLVHQDDNGKRSIRFIIINNLCVAPTQPAWAAAKIFALQGAAYHILFVTHPAIHFPMDSVNAITKTAVPLTHPLFQLLIPHTNYALALDNTVLESSYSVVNNNAQGTWFDPLTGEAPNLKLLFAAGYSGLEEMPDSYPRYNYQAPVVNFDSAYGRWLQAYYDRAFLPFCTTVAERILSAYVNENTYVTRWAHYLSMCIFGFPKASEILDRDVLAATLAHYMFDVSISHGADHATFGAVSPADKFLRIRQAPPKTVDDSLNGPIADGDDLFRAAMAQAMFFVPATMLPNLNDTGYGFTDPVLFEAQLAFHQHLKEVSLDSSLEHFMPLVPDSASDPEIPYSATIPQSIQF